MGNDCHYKLFITQDSSTPYPHLFAQNYNQKKVQLIKTIKYKYAEPSSYRQNIINHLSNIQNLPNRTIISINKVSLDKNTTEYKWIIIISLPTIDPNKPSN